MPELCARTPGAWLATSSLAVDEARSTGRGFCGKRGFASRQARHAAIRSSSAPTGSASEFADEPVFGDANACGPDFVDLAEGRVAKVCHQNGARAQTRQVGAQCGPIDVVGNRRGA